MPDRLSRPPVKLTGAQPDGTKNGLAAAAKHFLGPDHGEHRYLIVEVGRSELRHKDATGTDVAVLENIAVAMPDAQADLGKLLAETLAAQFEGTIPAFPVTDRARYEDALKDWAEREDMGPAEVRTEWEKHFGPDAPAGPTGAETAHLVEFVLEVCGLPEEPAEPQP